MTHCLSEGALVKSDLNYYDEVGQAITKEQLNDMYFTGTSNGSVESGNKRVSMPMNEYDADLNNT
jgi:hypothetical protein